MSKILTIGIPAYNIEPYIKTIMDSLLAAKCLPELDIIIVNDGSKDNTKVLAEEYKKKYPDSISVIDKENGGHGSTINASVKAAKGIYFKVIDGDDWVDTTSLDNLVEIMKDATEDMIVSDYCFVDDSGELIKRKIVCKEDFNYGRTYSIDEICQNSMEFYPFHSIYYRTDIIKKSLRIDENCFYVDLEYALFPLEYVKNIKFYGESVYMYRIGRDGQSVSVNGYIKHRWDLRTVLFSLCEFYTRADLSDAKKAYILKRISGLYATIVEVYITLGNKREALQYLPIIDNELAKRYNTIFYMIKNNLAQKIRSVNYHFYGLLRLYRKYKPLSSYEETI